MKIVMNGGMSFRTSIIILIRALRDENIRKYVTPLIPIIDMQTRCKYSQLIELSMFNKWLII